MKDFWQPEELVIGSVWGLSVGLAFGGPIWLTGPACAVLWRLGGMGFMDTKIWRRLGVPLILSVTALLQGHPWAWIGLSAFAPLSMGYGIPQTDESPSALGKFWAYFFPLDIWKTNMFTRGTCHLLTAICLIPTWK